MPNEYRSAYVRRSVRVSRLVAERCRHIAELEGWETADLVRTLVCMGAAFAFLRLEKAEFQKRHRRRVMLSRMLGQLNPILGERSRRPHALPRVGGSGLITLRLPQGVSKFMTAYAQTCGSSPNSMLSMFLECGLIIYSKGEKSLLETMRSLKQDHTQTESPEKPHAPQVGVHVGDADAEHGSSTRM
jgi:hypothetical protein